MIALWLLLGSALAAGQAAPPKQLMSEQAFKNVTVLKGIPVDEFMNTMGFIAAATNYNCIDCHVEPKKEGDWSTYAQETPRKATARRSDATASSCCPIACRAVPRVHNASG